MSALTYSGTLVVETCWCGLRHAIPQELARQAVDNGHTVYCPLGHAWVIKGKTTEQLLADAQAQSERRRQLLIDEREQHERTTRRLNATRGVVTRTKKRIAAGVCPCCRRHFTALERHMASQHPDYTTEAEPGG